MRRYIYYIIFTCINLLFNNISKAQTSSDKVSISRDATSAAGETVTTQGISVTYILGEAVGEFFSNPEASKYVTSGFIQPDVEIKEILDRDISTGLALFPNPVRNGQVKLAFNNVPDGQYTIEIIDALGRILKSQSVDFKKDDFLYIDLDVSSLVKGIYFLKVGSKDFKGQVKLIKL